MYLTFVKEFLSPYVEDVSFVDDNKSIQYLFVSAITHSSIDKDMNYEELEFLGDRRLKSAMNSYLFTRFPDVKNKQEVFSEMQKYLDSEIFLIQLSEKMGLVEYIKIDEKEDKVKAAEDVFEAFIGAIYLAMYELGGVEYAASVVEKIIHDIMDKEEVTPERRKEFRSHKSELKTRLEQNRVRGEPNYSLVKKTNNFTYVVVKIKGVEIGSARGKNKAEAENNAADDAVNHLDSYTLNLIRNRKY